MTPTPRTLGELLAQMEEDAALLHGRGFGVAAISRELEDQAAKLRLLLYGDEHHPSLYVRLWRENQPLQDAIRAEIETDPRGGIA